MSEGIEQFSQVIYLLLQLLTPISIGHQQAMSYSCHNLCC